MGQKIEAGTEETDRHAVTGTVFYLQRMALPPDAEIHVMLVDISRQDAAATVISRQVIAQPGQVPVPFELPYDPEIIDPRFTYGIQARIEAEGRLRFISTRVFPVITRGHPTRVEVRVDPVR
ncbi:MAG: YbaY family lipoprotein [Desulfobacterales bacterium]|jgi:uncharacterized lipoprotein YbaY